MAIDSHAGSIQFLTMSTWDFLATSSFEALRPEAQWTIFAILVSALIAAVAANHAADRSARLTMANAHEIQDRERKRDEKSVAALLRADLRNKLLALAAILSKPGKIREGSVYEAATSTRVFEAVLPKLGDLNPAAAASVLTIFYTIALLFGDALELPEHEFQQRIPQVRDFALVIGKSIHLIQRDYELDPLTPLKEVHVDLEALGLKELKDLGL